MLGNGLLLDGSVIRLFKIHVVDDHLIDEHSTLAILLVQGLCQLLLCQRLDLGAVGDLIGAKLGHGGLDGRCHQLVTDQILGVGYIGIQPCTLFREHLIGHDYICGIHRSLVGGFAPDLCLDVLVLLLVGHGMDALDKRNGEVELAALDGGLLNLAEAGLHARVAGWHDGHRLEQQEGHEDDSEQGKYTMLFHIENLLIQ